MRKQIIIFTLIIIALIIAGGISTKEKKYPANYNFVINGTGDSLFRASPDSVAMYVAKSTRMKDTLDAHDTRTRAWAGAEDNSTLAVAFDSTKSLENQYFEQLPGKNLFDMATMLIEGYYVKSTEPSGGSLVADADSWVTTLIAIEPQKTYVSSGLPTASFVRRYYDASQTYLSWNNSGTQYFTTPPGAYYVQFTLALNIAVPDFSTSQLEKGTIATSYQSYRTIPNLKNNTTVMNLKNAYITAMNDGDSAVVSKRYIEDNYHNRKNDGIIILKKGNDLWLRTKYDSTRVLLQRLKCFQTGGYYASAPADFYYTYLTPDTNGYTNSTDLIRNYVNIHTMGDDSAPLFYNGGHIGANHAPTIMVSVVSSGHGKTVEDVGSTWTDASSRKYYIMRVASADTLFVISENTGTREKWAFDTSISGNLTHSAGATHTGTITVTSSAATGFYPIITNQEKVVYLSDGAEITINSPDSLYFAEWVDMRDYYEIQNPDSARSYVISQIGSSTQPSLSNGNSQVTMNTSYRFDRWGGCKVTVSHVYNQLVDIYKESAGLQAYRLYRNTVAYDSMYMYAPNTLPIPDGAGKSWDFRTLKSTTLSPSTNLNFNSTYWADANLIPYRVQAYLGEEYESLQVAFISMINPYKGYGLNSIRKTLATDGNQIASTRKIYMIGADYKAGDITAGTVYEYDCFRGYTYPRRWSNNTTNCFIYPDTENSYYLIIDYMKSVTNDRIKLPDEFTGMSITVMEKHSDITVKNTIVTGGGIYISCSGATGYAVLKLE